MERSYREVVKRCKELKEQYGDAVGPCKGSRDALEKRISEFERTLNVSKEPEADMDDVVTLSLPDELITHELFKWLSVKDILSFCQSNGTARKRCEDLAIWKDRFASLSYRQAQDAILHWSYSGVMLDTLVGVLPSLFPLLDGNTIIHVYLYFVEQDKKAVIDPLVQVIVGHYEGTISSSYLREQFHRYFTINRSLYKLIDTLIGALKRLSSATSTKGQYTKIMNSLPYSIRRNDVVTDYIDRLIVHNLSDDELIAIFETYGTGTELRLGSKHFDLSGAIGRGLITSKRLLIPSKLKDVASPYLADDYYTKERNLYLTTNTEAKAWLLKYCTTDNDPYIIFPTRLYELFEPEELLLAVGDDKQLIEKIVHGCAHHSYDMWAELFRQAERRRGDKVV